MIDIVIPLADKTKNNHFELKIALRSMDKFLIETKDVYLIGNCPDWAQNITHIPQKDHPDIKFKERNIFNKITTACNIEDITPHFLFMNDDHFLLQHFSAPEFPYYHRGELYETMKKNKGDYRRTCNHSRRILLNQNLSTLDADTHCPIVYDKEKFLTTFESIDWQKPWGFAIKSLYCNLNNIEMEYYPDCKMHKASYEQMKQKTHGRKFFSTGMITEDMTRFLLELYPKKSKYES